MHTIITIVFMLFILPLALLTLSGVLLALVLFILLKYLLDVYYDCTHNDYKREFYDD